MLKTVEEYSKEMTRLEFDKFTELEELCPSHLGLKEVDSEECDIENCTKCWNQALVGVEFKSAVPGLPQEIMPVLKQLQELEIHSAKLEEAKKELKEDLLKAMESHGLKKWDNEVMTVTYTAPTTRTSVDSAKLKKDLPEIFNEYSKTSNVKSSIRIKLKGEK